MICQIFVRLLIFNFSAILKYDTYHMQPWVTTNLKISSRLQETLYSVTSNPDFMFLHILVSKMLHSAFHEFIFKHTNDMNSAYHSVYFVDRLPTSPFIDISDSNPVLMVSLLVLVVILVLISNSLSTIQSLQH